MRGPGHEFDYDNHRDGDRDKEMNVESMAWKRHRFEFFGAVFACLLAGFVLTVAVHAQAPLDTVEDSPLESLLPSVEDESNDVEKSKMKAETTPARRAKPSLADSEKGDDSEFDLEARERAMLRSTLGDNYEEKLRESGAGASKAPFEAPPADAVRQPRRLPERRGLADMGDAVAEEVISYGDVIRIMMIEDPNMFYEGPVSANGTVAIPYLGEFPVAGLTQRQAMKQLSDRLESELYLNATTSVTLVARGGGNVYIYGAVNQQGAIEIPKYGRLTILRLILKSGGLSGWAAPEDTFIMRRLSGVAEMQRINVNLKEIFATSYPESGKDVPLMDGDIVVVPGLNGELYQFMSAADREVIVVGEVGSPGIVNFSAGELRTLMRAIFKAGSFTQFAKKTAVKVIRYDPDRTRREMQVDVEAIMEEGELHKDIELQPGDMVIVPEKKINL